MLKEAHHWLRNSPVLKHYYSQQHKKQTRGFIDKVIFVVALFSPIMTIPQVWKIWSDKDAAGVSALTWSSYIFTSIIWLMYGIYHREKPIIISYILWIILEVIIVIGTLMYS